jgi:predicted ribosomally synthesized peptide with SipW-like signal peptide
LPVRASPITIKEGEKVKRKVLASLLVIAVVAGLVGASTWAYFSNTVAADINTSNATVKVGALTGFPLNFTDLIPGQWTGWKEVSVNNASTIPADLYLGLHDHLSTCDLKDQLSVQIERYDGSSWVSVYDADVKWLFDAWQKVAEDMPASLTYYYQVRVQLVASYTDQTCKTDAYVLIYAVQPDGPVPTTAPWQTP